MYPYAGTISDAVGAIFSLILFWGVITGSPRKNGNSFAMTEAFIRAVDEKGHTVTRFDAALKKVGADCLL